MTYLIDAWLDRPHPYLRILHRETTFLMSRSFRNASPEHAGSPSPR